MTCLDSFFFCWKFPVSTLEVQSREASVNHARGHGMRPVQWVQASRPGDDLMRPPTLLVFLRAPMRAGALAGSAYDH